MTDYQQLISSLSGEGVQFIIVGGAAAIVHGSSRLTDDLDVVYRRDSDNIERLVNALKGHNPYPRGAPPDLPFKWDPQTIWKGLNFTLTTTLGSINLLGEITLGGNYEELFPYTIQLKVFGHECLCLNLERLIEVKRAVGRPKDFESIIELESILEERNS
jgi:predicted nucleotidyltransferase